MAWEQRKNKRQFVDWKKKGSDRSPLKLIYGLSNDRGSENGEGISKKLFNSMDDTRHGRSLERLSKLAGDIDSKKS